MGRPQFLTFGIEKTGMESDGMFVQGPEQACRVETLAEASGRAEGEAKPCSERNASPWEERMRSPPVWRKQVRSKLVREHLGFDMV